MISARLRWGILLLAFCSAFGSAAWAKKAINLSALPADVQSDVFKHFPQMQKEKISLEQVDDLIRFLHTKSQFEQVKVLDESPTEYKLQFTKRRSILGIKFVGLNSLSESEARNYFTLKVGDPFDQNQIISNGENLRQAYRSLGFQNVVIDIELPGDPDLITVVVKITENKQTQIASYAFNSPNENLNRLLAREMRSHTGLALTDANLADTQKRIRSALNRAHFIRADVTGPEIKFNSDESVADLDYRITRVEKYEVDFQGNSRESDSTIEGTLDLKNFYSANPAVGTELAAKIKNYYLSQGYARVEVTPTETVGRTSWDRKVVINIDEGPKVKIAKYVVNGKVSRGSDYYEKFLRKNAPPLILKGYYNKENLDDALKNLILELQNEGFLLSKLLSTRTQYNREKNQVTVIVNLDEGPLTEVQSIQFDGNLSFDSEKLLQISKLHSTGPLKLNEIEAAVVNLKNFYKENGYIEMLLLNEKEDLVTYDETNTRARLNFKIFEGPQVRVASIVLEGNNFTKDYVLLKELEFVPGDIVTPAKIDESIARLQRTGFFGSVDVRTLEEKTNTANRTVIVRVTERDPGVLTLGAGATSERLFTLRGYSGVAYRNIEGTGRGISLRLEGNYNIAQIKYLESKITLGYLEPYLFDTRVRGRVNLSRSKAVTDYGLRQVTEINQVNYLVEKDFTSRILGVYEVLGIATIKQTGIDTSYPLPTTNVDIATTGPSVDIDFRDDPFNPTKGTFTRLGAEYASPLLSTRTIEYVRTTASFTHYLKLAEGPWVLANNIQGGYLKNMNNQPNGGVPYDLKGFILGGRSTVRGFEPGTQDVFPNKTDLGTDQYTMSTAARMFLIKSEIRFPVYGKIGGTVFYDGGYVAIENLALSDNYRDAAGFELRYITPVGPLNAGFAWKLDRREGEAPFRFNLSIGSF